MNQATEQWFILGAGAIGHLFACRFAEFNIAATLITHHKDFKATQQVVYCDNTSIDKKPQIYSLTYQHQLNIQKVDNLLLTVKSHQVEDAILGIKHALTKQSKIFLLQNGMGHLEKVTYLLKGIVPAHHIIPGTNTHGVYLNNKEVISVIHAGHGEVIFGANFLEANKTIANADTLSADNKYINQLLRLNLSIKFADDIEKRLWLKLAINAVINPMTAVQGCLNGELLESLTLKKQIDSLCKETADLFDQLKLSIDQQTIINAVYSVINKTSKNESSMLQDITSGKRTEIEAISGHLLYLAKLNKVKMPSHTSIYHQIQNQSFIEPCEKL